MILIYNYGNTHLCFMIVKICHSRTIIYTVITPRGRNKEMGIRDKRSGRERER